MSAVFDTLRQEALEREETGFTTMRAQPFGFFVEPGDFWSTANQTLVTSTASMGSYVVAYSAPKLNRIASMSNWDVDTGLLGVVRSDSFFVRRHANTATMSGGAVLLIAFGPSQERGVIVLNMPRKKIHTQTVSFFTAQLKRKVPHVILGGRTHGEENA